MDSSKYTADPLNVFKKIDSDEFSENYDTEKLFLGIQRHHFVIVMFTTLFGILASYASFMFQTTYEAESLIIYQEEEAPSRDIEGGLTLTYLSLSTVLDLIKLPGHFDAVKKTLGLDLSPQEIEEMVKIPVPKNESNLIRILVRAGNPSLAVDIANALAKVSVKSSQEFIQKQLQMALNGYQAQLAVARNSLSGHIKDIEMFKEKNQLFEMDPDKSILLATVEDNRKLREKADLEYQSLLVQYDNLKEEAIKLPEYVPLSMDSKDSPLQLRIISLETTLAEARAKYTTDNPKLMRLEEELKELHRRNNRDTSSESEEKFYQRNAVRDTIDLELMHLQGKVQSARKVKEELEQSTRVLDRKLISLPNVQMGFVKLLQSKQLAEEHLAAMNKAAETIQLMINVPKGSIDLYQPAREAKPWKGALWVYALPLFGLVFGFGVGVSCAVLLEMCDAKYRTAKQLEMYYHIPCIGCIPELSRLNWQNVERKLLFFVRNLAEYIDKQILVKGVSHPTVVAVTGSLAKEGKSLLSSLTAQYYSRLGKRVLLLEMDPGKKMTADEESPLKVSIADYLKGGRAIDEVILKGSPDRAGLISREPNMKELLKTQPMLDFLKYVKSKYDLILIDTPGVIEEDYAPNLNFLSDLRVFVVGSSKTEKKIVDESLRVLEFIGARPSSLLLNRIHPAYVKDKRVLLEIKRNKGTLLQSVFLWRT